MIMMTWKGLVKLLMITRVLISFVLSLAHVFYFWQNACNFSACKKTNRHPCLIFWNCDCPLLTYSACIYYFYILQFYWNGVTSVYGMDRWAKDRMSDSGHGGVRELWQSCLVSLALVSRGGQGKSTQTPTYTLSWRTGRGLDSCLQFRLCICVLCNLHYYIFYHTLLTERWTEERSRRGQVHTCHHHNYSIKCGNLKPLP